MNDAASVSYGAEPMGMRLTERFAEFSSDLRFEDLPSTVVHECKRGVLDWIGCAIAGSRHSTISKLLAGLRDIGSLQSVPVIGHDERLGLLEAALVNGQAGHVLDYDDTHMDGVVLHTSSPTMGALLSAACDTPGDGRRLILAYTLAFEIGVRVGKSAPDHHDGGWHLTGTLGSIAAGCASAKFFGLDARQTTHAIALAATQAAGLQQNRGTMAKSFHAGKAASNGLLSAVLARRGFDSSLEILEGRRGFMRVFSARSEPNAILAELGDDWQIVRNGYKPYACGVVLHPALDAMIDIHARVRRPTNIREAQVRVHPQAIRITGLVDPQSGLQSKFSLSHATAVSMIDGAAGLRQFDDVRARADDVLSLASRIRIVPDETLGIDGARAHVVDEDGQRHDVFVEHASGTASNPMSDEVLEKKFFENVSSVIAPDAVRSLRDAIWDLDRLADIRQLGRNAP